MSVSRRLEAGAMFAGCIVFGAVLGSIGSPPCDPGDVLRGALLGFAAGLVGLLLEALTFPLTRETP